MKPERRLERAVQAVLKRKVRNTEGGVIRAG
jgi:hypothetical protein